MTSACRRRAAGALSTVWRLPKTMHPDGFGHAVDLHPASANDCQRAILVLIAVVVLRLLPYRPVLERNDGAAIPARPCASYPRSQRLLHLQPFQRRSTHLAAQL